MNQSEACKVTVIVPLYNKAAYLGPALDSVLRQQADFRFRIVVADDCSTDGSLEIALQYQREHPETISVLPSNQNRKLFKNIVRAYADIRTPYFCVLGPDDYWCDDHKLQKAVGFLDGHREYTIYATDSIMLFPDGRQKRYIGRDSECDSSFSDFLNGCAVFGNALGTVFRNVVFNNGLPLKLRQDLCADQEASFRGDTFLSVTHLHEGLCHYVPECDAVYRILGSGLWQSMSEFQQQLFNCMIMINLHEYFDGRYDVLRARAYGGVLELKEKYWNFVCEDKSSALSEVTLQMRDVLLRSAPRISANGCKWSVRRRIYYKLYRHLQKRMLRRGWL